jgi:hypothetical protein
MITIKSRVRRGVETHTIAQHSNNTNTSKRKSARIKRWSHNSRTRSNLSLTNQQRGHRGSKLWCAQSMLGYQLHAPWGGPFIAPRDLGAVEASFGRPWLPSVHWCTELSGAHQTPHSLRFCFLNLPSRLLLVFDRLTHWTIR